MNHSSTILAGSSALSPIGSDAELIATCAAFCELEHSANAIIRDMSDDAAKEAIRDAPLAKIAAEQDALVERMTALPCTTLAGVQAIAAALAIWDCELLKSGPSSDVGEVITSHVIDRLLALRHPDADLLAVCSEFCVSEATYSALYDGTPKAYDATSEMALFTRGKAITDTWEAMLDRMAQLRATTSEGLAARAMALAQHSGIKPGTSSYPFAFRPDEAKDVTGCLLHMLLTDAVRIGCVLRPNPDAELLALRPEFDRLHAVMIDYNTPDLIPEGGTECADFDALCDRIASASPAVTADGRAFQAAAAMHHLTYRLNDCEQEHNPAWLMLKGIAGDAYRSVEAAQRQEV